MQRSNKRIKGLLRTGRVLLKMFLFLFLFVLLIFLLLLSPPVQQFATSRVENYLEKKLKTKVDIGRIAITFPRKITLENIYIEDQSKDTLIAGGTINADVALLKLMSNEVEVKDLQLNDIVAKVKRTLPDTVYNFQFIVDAFVKEQTSKTDTSETAVLKLDVQNLLLNNFKVQYQDVVTGSDMFAYVQKLEANIDTLNPYLPQLAVPSLSVTGMRVRFHQESPLATPEPLAKDLQEAAAPTPLKLNLGRITLDKVSIEYGNNVSAFYTNFDIGHLTLSGKKIDLSERMLHLEKLEMAQAFTAIRFGKKEAAKVLASEIKKEVEVQKQKNWVIRIDDTRFDNNIFQYDNENKPIQNYGIDYAHMRADSLTLHVKNFVLNADSIAGNISKGIFKEKSGFELQALEGDVLYANNQSYLKNLYIKTPGTELKRNAFLEYTSYEALFERFEETVMDVELVNSHVQVKDILSFAPALRRHPAFRNPYDVWQLNIVGSGTMNRLNFESLQFDGLKDTRIDATGTLAGLNDPNAAGGTLTIRQLHTSQTDISLFTGQRLSTPQINLPETFSANGTISGNMQNLATNLAIATSMGNARVNGRFQNLANPAKTAYNAQVSTSSLQLGRILKNPQIGAVTANMKVQGIGFTPASINTKFNGVINAIGFNKYTYRNIKLNGSLRQTNFNIDADIRDPNADLTATASGNFSSAASFRVKASVDSLKTFPLHLTAQPLLFHGNVDADIISFNPDYLEGSVFISDALFVSNDQRLPVDSMSLVSGRTSAGQFIALTSDVANARLEGQYRFADLAYIIQNNIQPYFSVSSQRRVFQVQPYDFTFKADIANSPFIAAFVPGLKIVAPIHAEGSMATGRGLQGNISTASLIYGTNTIKDLNFTVNTTSRGLEINGVAGHLQTGNALDIYNTRINAIANNNIIDFTTSIDDKGGNLKYQLGGLLTQPSGGTYAIQLRPDSLLLNYERWTVSAGNQIIISPSNIGANDFILSQGNQQIALQSLGGNSGPLNARFTDFRLATITGFMKSDSLLADGRLNGTVTFRNLMQQPLFTSDLTITDLSMKGDTIGNVLLQVNNPSPNQYVISNATITGRGNDVVITGAMSPQGDDVALNLNLNIRNLELNTFEGALATAIRQASGSVNGNVKIGGTLAVPDLDGQINFNNASFNTVLLGGRFKIDQEQLRVSENGFNFDNFVIRDSLNNALTLNGNVQTNNFINYYFNLDIDADNFQLLNTTKKDNKIYYGKLVLSSELHIAGTEEKPIIDGAVTINDKTNLTVVIPQKEPGAAEREGVVQFVDMDAPFSDSLFLSAYDSLNISNLIGFDISTNIEIKKEAVLNLVIDEANGDFVNLQGEALLTAGIDPSGKISLTGSYVLEQGSYELSFNFLHRKFEIQKGSTIVWLGEPTRARLDVTGLYIANAAPIDLVQNQIEASSTALRNTYFLQKLPFEVYLKVTGELMKPVVSFDIQLPPEKSYVVSKDVIQLVESRLQQIRQEPSEVNKQVFSLLLLNRFVGENPFQSSGEGFSVSALARQSVSQLLSDQLNRLAGGLVAGVDVDLNVSSSDDYTTGVRQNRTDLNIGLSKRLLNERLTITVGSNFELDGPANSNQRSNNLAGDVQLNYKLSKDGRYMLRAYRKNEYQGVIEGFIIESGLGFSINVDYDKFKEIFTGKKTKIEGIEEPKPAAQ